MATSVKDAALVQSEPRTEAAMGWPGWVLWLKHLLGLDRAIAYTVMARGVQILGSTGTVLLILRFLTPVEQGYYYTLLSLVSLQAVFELGFSFVILQMAAHECARLTLHADGRVEGDAVAHARLASILQKAFRWYLVAAVILCVSLLPAGAYFFSRHARTAVPVAWHGPWAVAVFATAFLFLLNPFFSFLEGCGQVWQVGRMRLCQALLGAAMSWGALLAHHGLYSPGMVNIGYAAAGLAFLYSRRKLCLGLLRYAVREQSVCWRKEIWPFQSKIAVSWISAYFSYTVFVPILFAYRGPTEAGQIGMSLSITGYLSILVLAWMSTKAAPFGMLIARGKFTELDDVFFRTLKQSLTVLLGLVVLSMLGMIGAQYTFQKLAARMVPPPIFALLLLAMISTFIIQSEAVYLRAHRNEPFMWQSAVIAGMTTGVAVLLAPRWGLVGVGVTHVVCTGIIGLLWATVIFHRKRKSWRSSSQISFEGRHLETLGT